MLWKLIEASKVKVKKKFEIEMKKIAIIRYLVRKEDTHTHIVDSMMINQ